MVDCVRRCVRCGVARLLFRVYTLVSVASGSVVWLVLKCLRLSGCCCHTHKGCHGKTAAGKDRPKYSGPNFSQFLV